MKRKRAQKRRKASDDSPAPLLYKVVELSAVDEGSLERTLNQWVPQGWSYDGVQFAMRESSKRPAMAFVFFTRRGLLGAEDGRRSAAAATSQLQRLAEAPPPGPAKAPVSAYERLLQLADDGEDGL